MSEESSFLRDLDEAVARGTPESRIRALWHTTDLLITGRYSDEEIWTFGEVIGRLAEQLGLRRDIPRHLFQQLIAKASDDVRKRLEGERPDMVEQIQSTVTDVAGALQSRLGPVSRTYFVAKRVVSTQFHQGNLNEN